MAEQWALTEALARFRRALLRDSRFSGTEAMLMVRTIEKTTSPKRNEKGRCYDNAAIVKFSTVFFVIPPPADKCETLGSAKERARLGLCS